MLSVEKDCGRLCHERCFNKWRTEHKKRVKMDQTPYTCQICVNEEIRQGVTCVECETPISSEEQKEAVSCTICGCHTHKECFLVWEHVNGEACAQTGAGYICSKCISEKRVPITYPEKKQSENCLECGELLEPEQRKASETCPLCEGHTHKECFDIWNQTNEEASIKAKVRYICQKCVNEGRIEKLDQCRQCWRLILAGAMECKRCRTTVCGPCAVQGDGKLDPIVVQCHDCRQEFFRCLGCKCLFETDNDGCGVCKVGFHACGQESDDQANDDGTFTCKHCVGRGQKRKFKSWI